MITEYHFPTMIYIKDFPDSEKLNKYLEEHIIRWSQNDKGVSKQMQVDGTVQRI